MRNLILTHAPNEQASAETNWSRDIINVSITDQTLWLVMPFRIVANSVKDRVWNYGVVPKLTFHLRLS